MQIVKDDAAVEALMQIYLPLMRRRSRHDVTGDKLKLPKDRTALVKILNYAIADPQVVFVWGKELAATQLAIWTPYINRSRYRFAVFAAANTKASGFDPSKVNAQILAAADGTPMEKYLGVSASLKALLYVTAKSPNYFYVKNWPSKVHIFANHGDSDKHTNLSRANTIYDFVMVADRFAAERFMRAGVALDVSRFMFVGGSVIDGVRVRAGNLAGGANLLYAPTWEGYRSAMSFSSLIKSQSRIEEYIRSGAALRFRPHPATGLENKVFGKAKNSISSLIAKPVITSKAEDFNWSDAIVTDISGVMTEYVYTRKPVIVACGSSDKLLKRYLRKTSIPDFAYVWDYETQPLQSVQKIILADKLGRDRVARREATFFGIQSIEESVALFDQALDLAAASHRNRSRFFGHSGVAEPEPPDPGSTHLKEIVGRIRSGEICLG